MLLSSIVKFLIGIIILLVSTRILTKTAEKLSLSLKISPLLIGLTIVAIGTSLPELAVSTTAAIKGDHGLAMGNVVGSNIVNVLFIFPIGIVIGKLRVGTTKTQRNVWILLAVTLTFVILQIFKINHVYSALILFGIGGIISFFQYRFAQEAKTHEDKKMFTNQKSSKLNIFSIIYLLPVVIGIIIGSFMTVISIEEISFVTGLSTTVLGLSLSALATSLPELMTTIFSQEEHQDKLTLGNILGSNIYNLTLIGSVAIFVSGNNGLPAKDIFILLASAIAFIFVLVKYKGENIPRKIGFIFLSFFVLYLLSLR